MCSRGGGGGTVGSALSALRSLLIMSITTTATSISFMAGRVSDAGSRTDDVFPLPIPLSFSRAAVTSVYRCIAFDDYMRGFSISNICALTALRADNCYNTRRRRIYDNALSLDDDHDTVYLVLAYAGEDYRVQSVMISSSTTQYILTRYTCHDDGCEPVIIRWRVPNGHQQ